MDGVHFEERVEQFLKDHIVYFTDAKDEVFDYLYENNRTENTILANVNGHLDIVNS